jgi:hypothetical protein
MDIGGAGYRSRYFSHAKRALYHLSYAPSYENCKEINLFKLVNWSQTVYRIFMFFCCELQQIFFLHSGQRPEEQSEERGVGEVRPQP